MIHKLHVTRLTPSRLIPFLGLALALLASTSAWAGDPLPHPQVDFKRDVYPILLAHCFKCHQGSDASSEVRLDIRAELLAETKGPLVLPGRGAESRLVQLVSGDLGDERMPPAGKGHPLTARQVAALRAWVDQGLVWDNKVLPPPEAAARHWAFQPVERPAVPTESTAAANWVRTPVDRFIAARHTALGVSPAPEASRSTLLRRLSLDLTGLPPTPDELVAFVNDSSPDAYEKQVERLLASPHYGERWGRHWLDLARYADTEGYESNKPRNFAWRYRDWVVAAFNADKPYDQFLREQIAGDELLPYRDENLIATGFLAAARLSSNEEDKALQRNDVLVDVVNATASAVLGLTFNCAQCHSHKFDPITHHDYYRFQGFFVRGQPNILELKDQSLWQEYEAKKPAEYDPAHELRDALLAKARQRLETAAREKLSEEMRAALDKPAADRNAAEQELARAADLKFQFTPQQIEKALADEDKPLFEQLKKKLDALKSKLPTKPQTWAFYSPATSPTPVSYIQSDGFYPLPYEPETLKRSKAYLLVRGDVHNRGSAVEPGWPAVLGAVPAEQQRQIAERPRTALADWLAHRRNPLTARVWANRVWQHHFGRGIVATPGDFGVKGAPPTHPELLDWLAAELMERGWSTRHLHRLIVKSATYRQASRHDIAGVQAENERRDPENQAWWRWQPRRLESEAIRDAALAAAGELDRRLGGPGVAREQEDQELRRSLYLFQKRDDFPAMQALFDGPIANESCSQRNVSTVALQPLYLLNNPFLLARAEQFARRVQKEAGEDRGKQIELAFAIALSRKLDARDRDAALAYFAEIAEQDAEKANEEPAAAPASADKPTTALVHFCQALLNTNEFLYLE